MKAGRDVLQDLRDAKANLAKQRQGAERRDAELRQAESARVRARRAVAEAQRAYDAAREAAFRAFPDGA